MFASSSEDCPPGTVEAEREREREVTASVGPLILLLGSHNAGGGGGGGVYRPYLERRGFFLQGDALAEAGL